MMILLVLGLKGVNLYFRKSLDHVCFFGDCCYGKVNNIQSYPTNLYILPIDNHERQLISIYQVIFGMFYKVPFTSGNFSHLKDGILPSHGIVRLHYFPLDIRSILTPVPFLVRPIQGTYKYSDLFN